MPQSFRAYRSTGRELLNRIMWFMFIVGACSELANWLILEILIAVWYKLSSRKLGLHFRFRKVEFYFALTCCEYELAS